MKSLAAVLIPLALLAATPRADAAGKCSQFDCGTNSPVIDGLGFHELNVVGELNAQGLRLGDLVNPATGSRHRVRVLEDQLVGQSKLFPYWTVVTGEQLVGRYIEVFRGRSTYRLKILHVTRAVDYLVAPGQGDRFDTYQFAWSPETDLHVAEPLCPEYEAGQPGVTQAMLESVVFTGNRYDAPTKDLLAAAASDPYWFNLGCYNTTLYKLKTTRHNDQAASPAFAASRELQQAMVRLWTGDVCGDGDAHTEQGTPLYWQNQAGVGSAWYGSPDETTEGMWGADGALCVSDYRLGWPYYLAEIDCDPSPLVIARPPLCPTTFGGMWALPGAQAYSSFPIP